MISLPSFQKPPVLISLLLADATLAIFEPCDRGGLFSLFAATDAGLEAATEAGFQDAYDLGGFSDYRWEGACECFEAGAGASAAGSASA